MSRARSASRHEDVEKREVDLKPKMGKLVVKRSSSEDTRLSAMSARNSESSGEHYVHVVDTIVALHVGLQCVIESHVF